MKRAYTKVSICLLRTYACTCVPRQVAATECSKLSLRICVLMHACTGVSMNCTFMCAHTCKEGHRSGDCRYQCERVEGPIHHVCLDACKQPRHVLYALLLVLCQHAHVSRVYAYVCIYIYVCMYGSMCIRIRHRVHDPFLSSLHGHVQQPSPAERACVHYIQTHTYKHHAYNMHE